MDDKAQLIHQEKVTDPTDLKCSEFVSEQHVKRNIQVEKSPEGANQSKENCCRSDFHLRKTNRGHQETNKKRKDGGDGIWKNSIVDIGIK